MKETMRMVIIHSLIGVLVFFGREGKPGNRTAEFHLSGDGDRQQRLKL